MGGNQSTCTWDNKKYNKKTHYCSKTGVQQKKRERIPMWNNTS